MWHGAPRLTLEIKGSGPGGKTDLTVMGSITCMLTCFQIGVTKSASESQAVTLRLLLVATTPGPDRDGQGPGLPGGSGARAGPVQHRAAVAGKAGRPRWPPRPPTPLDGSSGPGIAAPRIEDGLPRPQQQRHPHRAVLKLD